MLTTKGTGMDFSFADYYVLREAQTKGALRVRCKEKLNQFRIHRGDNPEDQVFIFEEAVGGKLYDVISTGYAGLYLYSDKFVNLLRTHECTGWKCYPVKIYSRYGQSINGYNGVSITGRCGPLINDQSQLVIGEPRVPGAPASKFWLGLYFDPENWDGSGIFSPDSSLTKLSIKILKIYWKIIT